MNHSLRVTSLQVWLILHTCLPASMSHLVCVLHCLNPINNSLWHPQYLQILCLPNVLLIRSADLWPQHWCPVRLKERSLALSHPDRLMNTQDEGHPPTLPGLLLYFGTLKMLSVAKGLLQLCAQSPGCFSSSPVEMSLELQSRQTSAWNEEWPAGYLNKANAWQRCVLQRSESVELLPVSPRCAGGVSQQHSPGEKWLPLGSIYSIE